MPHDVLLRDIESFLMRLPFLTFFRMYAICSAFPYIVFKTTYIPSKYEKFI